MAIIKKLDKKSGTVYVYESVSYWDREKKQPRSKRKLIGKLDPVTGEVIPTGKQGRRPRRESPCIPETAEKAPASSDTDTAVPDAASAPASAAPAAELPDSFDPDSIPVAPDLGLEDVWAMYRDCRRSLLEKETALAKAEGTIARLQLEKQQIQEQLEQLLKTMRR